MRLPALAKPLGRELAVAAIAGAIVRGTAAMWPEGMMLVAAIVIAAVGWRWQRQLSVARYDTGEDEADTDAGDAPR